MNTSLTLDRPGCAAKYGRALHYAILCFAVAWLAGFTVPARAADGCKVLLCFAAPSWRSIPQCVPPIQEVLHDLARGKPFPVCAMSGPANSASHQWSSAPAYCPPPAPVYYQPAPVYYHQPAPVVVYREPVVRFGFGYVRSWGRDSGRGHGYGHCR